MQLYRLTFWTRHSSYIRLQLTDVKEVNSITEQKGIVNSLAEQVSVSDLAADSSIADEKSTAYSNLYLPFLKSYSYYTILNDLSTVNLPPWRRAVNCLCGVETQKASQVPVAKPLVDPQEEAIMASNFIKEDPTWSK